MLIIVNVFFSPITGQAFINPPAMEIDPRLLSLNDLAVLAQTPRELVKVMMQSGMLRSTQNCSRCGKNMTLTTRGSAADGCIWRCRESRNQDCSMKSVRHGTSFERAKLSLADMLKFALMRTNKPADEITGFEVYREYILPDAADAAIQNEPCVSSDITSSLAMLSEQLGIEDPPKTPSRPASTSSKDTNDNNRADTTEQESLSSLFSSIAFSDDDNVALSFLVAAMADLLDSPIVSDVVKDNIWKKICHRMSQRVVDIELSPKGLKQHYGMLRNRAEFEGKSSRQIAEELYGKIKGTNHTVRFEDVFDTNHNINYPQWLFDIIFKDALLSRHVRHRRKRLGAGDGGSPKKKKMNTVQGDGSNETVFTNGSSPLPDGNHTVSTPLSFPFLAEESEFTSRQRREEELHQARNRREEEIHQAQLRHDEELHQARLAMQETERREVEARTQLTLLQVEIKRVELDALKR